MHILPEANEMYEGVLAQWEREHDAEMALEAMAHNETLEEHDEHHEDENHAETEAEHAAELDHAGETEEEHAAHADEAADHAGETEAEHAEHADEHGDEHGDEHADHDEGGHKFPLPFVLCEVGFFLMLIMNAISVPEKRDQPVKEI
mgnify:CR=1 FL=1